MSREHLFRLLSCTSAVWLVLLTGCTTMPSSTGHTVGVDIVDIGVTDDGADTNMDEEETPADWGDVKPTLYAPDPEYTPLSAADEIDDQDLLKEGVTAPDIAGSMADTEGESENSASATPVSGHRFDDCLSHKQLDY